ncbi:hypothetical protein [Ammoniphilus sp. YIM 78166]|nr:hypothetical protein [Ammoniphilus sp. YIM 78166]
MSHDRSIISKMLNYKKNQKETEDTDYFMEMAIDMEFPHSSESPDEEKE